jgi:hypothetical protein
MVCVGGVRPPRTPFFRNFSPQPEQLQNIYIHTSTIYVIGEINFEKELIT